MGQKVNPHGARVGVIIDWSTKWYAGKKDFSDKLIEDYKLRKLLKDRINALAAGSERGADKKAINQAGISHIDIQRAGDKIHLIIYTARPGVVIGKGAENVDLLKKEVEAFTGKQTNIDIIEIKNPDIDAQLVAENIASQLEKRVSFRRAMKQTIGRAMKSGAKGIKTTVSGRLGGADIARSEGYHEGSIPLQTLRAHIDYGFAEAKTTYGRIGVKVWIYKGQVLPSKENKGSRLVNAMSDSTLNGTGGGNRRDGRRRFDRNDRRGDRGGNRGDRAPRNHPASGAPAQKEGGK